MLTILLGAVLVYNRVGAIPIFPAPTTGPILHGIHARCDCPGTNPDGRTIYDIVKSCLFTIAACVYRAVHQNIPDPELGFWGRLRVTMKVTFYALVAPELIIWWAMKQWFGARRVVEWIHEAEPRLNWTKVHGQFVQMGGFARKDNKQVLRAWTIRKLLLDGLLDIEELQLTEKEIQDKSKGDILSKSLIAFQTTWFVFECIARLQQGLPLIKLEVVTLALATLNIITYALWWYKPLNVLCPIYIHVQPDPSYARTESNVDPSPPVVEAASPRDVSAGVGEANTEESMEGGSSESLVEPVAASGLVAGVSTSGREAVVGGTERTNEAESGEGPGTRVIGIIGGIVGINLKEDIEAHGWWWMLWKRFVKPPFLGVAKPLKDLLEDESRNDEATHVPTLSAEWVADDDKTLVQGLSSFIGVTFGGIHFLSWHSTFPTRVELLLWRISSTGLVVPPFFLLLRTLLFWIYQEAPSRSRRKRTAEILYLLFEKVSFFLGRVPYILARFCVLVLAFLTLHNLSPDALTNVSWTSYIPHL
ncbi:hypothetical protein BDN72DRAFT_179695 [Pluteus cervinus]|uniref:Uncharacterized protein n=1 Tax=Pluteus cervinus TaxID=181527 RepID=A0ACD3AIR7_9AGAR|nr:hypothetical protein BDN72DRAFT_179695 [Pluteus cervinus]